MGNLKTISRPRLVGNNGLFEHSPGMSEAGGEGGDTKCLA
jgi:hypothetical protein